MVNIQKSGDSAIKFTFTDNDRYLYDGEITVPLNSLILVFDESDMVVIKKVDGDVFLTFLIDNTNFSTKAELESWFKENACGSTGGGGGVTSGEVQTMIDESISGKADTSDVQEIASDVTTVSGDVNTLSGSVESLTGAVNTLSGDVSTLSGAVDSNHNAITAVVGDVQTLSGQVQGDETILTGHTANTDIHVTASDKQNWNNKSDFSGSYNDLTDKPTIPVVPTNVSAFNNDAGYATSGYVDSSVSGKMDTSTFNTYSANTDARLSEDEEVTAAALNSLNSNKQDKLTAGENITINGNVISAAGGNNVIELTQAEYDELTDIDPDAFYIITDAAGAVTTGQVQTMIDDSISGKADTSAVTEAVSSKMDTSSFNTYSASTDNRLSEDEEVTAAALNALSDAIDDKADTTAVTASIAAAVSDKQDTLVSGTNIKTINNESLLGSGNIDIQGGSSINVVQISGTSTGDVMSQNAVTNGLNDKIQDFNMSVHNWLGSGVTALDSSKNGSSYTTKTYVASINEKQIMTGSDYAKVNKFHLVEASAITTSVTSSSTDSQVPSAKAVYDVLVNKADTSAFTAHTADTTIHTTSAEKASWNGAATNASNAITALGGLKLVQLSQSEYDSLATKDASTLYIITGSN